MPIKAPSRSPCSNCRQKHRGRVLRKNARVCDRCREYSLTNCDVLDKTAKAEKSRQAQKAIAAATRKPAAQQPQTPADEPARRNANDVSELSAQAWKQGSRTLVVGVDAGTSKVSIEWQSVDSNQELSSDFRMMSSAVSIYGYSKEQTWRIPVTAAVSTEHGVSTVVCGPDEIENLQAASLHSRDIFRLLKLELVTNDNNADEHQRRIVKGSQERNREVFDRYRQRHALPSNIKTVLDVFQEYLKYIWNVIDNSLQEEFPSLSAQDFALALEKHTRIVVAAPECWPPTMRNRFRLMLRKAGFPSESLHIRSEAKLNAAAVAKHQYDGQVVSSDEANRALGITLSLTTARLMIDIGCGALDLVFTMILQHSPVLRFRTLTESDGYIYGGEYMNGIFRDDLRLLLAQRLEEIAENVGMSPDEVIESFTHGFEKAKRVFSKSWKGDFRIMWEPVTRCRPLKDMSVAANFQIGYNYLILPRQFIQNVFDKYLDRICEAITKQLDKLAVAENPGYSRISLDLVGGGSRMLYLYEKIKTLYDSKESYGFHMRVYRSKEDCSYVATGALLAGIDPQIGNQEIAGTSYGLSLTVPYDPRDPEHTADHDLCETAPAWHPGMKELYDRWQGIMIHGSDLRDSHTKISWDYEIEFEEEDLTWPYEIKQDIWECFDKELVKRDWWAIKEHPDKVRHLTRVRVRIDQKDVSWRPRKVNGHGFYQIHCRTRTVWDGICEQWLFFVSKNGKPIGDGPRGEVEALRATLELFDLPATYDDMEGRREAPTQVIQARAQDSCR